MHANIVAAWGFSFIGMVGHIEAFGWRSGRWEGEKGGEEAG